MKKKARLKQLALGIAAALLTASWQVPALAAEENEAIAEDKTLTNDTTVNIVGKGEEKPKNPAGVYVNNDRSLTLDMAGHDLKASLNFKDLRGRKAPSTRGAGLFIGSGSTLTIQSDKNNPNAPNRQIKINARGGWLDAGSTGGATSGIYFKDWARKPMKANINADVTVEQLWSGREPARGIWAPGKATLNLNGKFTIGPDGIYHYYTEAANGSDKKSPGAYGIHVEGENNNINIKSVDITANRIQRGIQLGGESGSAKKSTVRIGGGTFKVRENAARDHRLMYLKKTPKAADTNKVYFNVNENGTDAGTQTTDLEGFIDAEENNEVYLGLSNAASKWLGGTKHDAEGKTTLFLKNGATWDTTNSGRGSRIAKLSSTDGTAGNIFQKDKGKLTIDDYAGQQNIYYSHEGDGTDTSHYKAGDTIIKKAAAGSFVTMITDRASSTTTDEQIHKTLNALAGKLYYDEAKSGKTNLRGRAMLAEGLTASSAAQSLNSENITFDGSSGKGSTVNSIIRDRQIVEAGAPSMEQNEKWEQEGYRKPDESYSFDKDVVIRTKASRDDDDVIPSQRYYKGGVVVDEEDRKALVTVNMNGHRLTLNSTADMSAIKYKYACGIIATGTKLEIKNSGGIDINITGSGASKYGIYAFSTSRKEGGVTIHNDNAPEHAVRIRNTARGEKDSAIFAQSGSSKKTVIDIKGLVDIEQDSETLLYAKTRGEIRIGGGRLIAGANAKAVHITRDGKVLINATENGDGVNATSTERAVQIEGNVLLEGNGGIFGAALNTKNSYIKGKIGRTGNGSARLFLANGARWFNQSVGIHGDTIGKSYLSHLKSDGGSIYQNDNKDLNIGKFDGKATLFYEHENDGTASAHYKAGNTHIKSAAADSEITVATDATNVKTNDEQELYKTLNALAGKLYYDSASTESNLKGKAMIAEGLTASSASQKLEDIIFKKDAGGQGSVKTPGIVEKNQIAEIGAASKTLSDAWQTSKERDSQGNYTFNKDLTMHTKANGSGLISMDNHIGGVLMNSDGVPNGSTINMKRFKMTLHTENTTDAAKRAAGIGVVGTNLTVEEAGAVDINIKGDKDSASGIYAAATDNKDAAVRIKNGNAKEYTVKIRNEASGNKEAAISAKGKASKKAIVEITGLVDIEQDKDNLLSADGGEISIGGGSIKATGNAKAVQIKNNGKVLLNATENGDSLAASSEDRDVKLEGNVSVEGNTSVFGAALVTKNSFLNGKIVKTSGSTRLLLANGATWNNKSFGGNLTGSSHLTYLKSNGGAIQQNDDKDLTIDKFEGTAKLFYQHENDGTDSAHYKAGNTHIKSAAQGSEITIATDQTNVDLTDDAKVYKTLDALAGKLYYDAAKQGKTDLKGKAMIAEGLTASSMSKKLENITFKANGQGSVKEDVGNGMQIAEGNWNGAEREQKYWKKQGIRSGSTYTFNKDVRLSVNRNDNPVKAHNENGRYDFGGILWGKGQRGSINMKGHELNINVGDGTLKTQAGTLRGDESTGILVSGGTLEMKSLGKTTIRAKNNGIHLLGDSTKGNAELFVHNGAAADPTVTIRSDDKGIYLESTTGAAKLDIKGKVDIEAPQGIVVDRGQLTIGGGRIVSNGQAALYVNSLSTAKINAQMDSKGNIVPMDESRDVNIEGDIRVKDSSATAYLGLTTAKSYLKGLFTTDLYTWPLHQWELASGKGYLVLKNGATWEHIKVGTGKDKNGALELGDSRVDRLNSTGGKILQKDKRKIIVNDFRGDTTVHYDHDGDGTSAADYKAGDVIIRKAGDGSKITMVTENNGITMSDEAKVKNALNALAGKLYYDGAKNDQKDLKGTAMIAEGTTTSSAKRTADIIFNKDSGQGSVDTTAPQPPVPPPSTDPVNSEEQIAEMAGSTAQIDKWKAKHIRDDAANYTFANGATLQVKASDNTKQSIDDTVGNILVKDQNSSIDMKGKKLTLKAAADSDAKSAGNIRLEGGNLEIKNANGLDLSISGDKKAASAIYAAGNSKAANLNIKNAEGKENAVKIRNTASNKLAAITAKSKGRVTIQGQADIEQEGKELLHADGGEISIGGGRLIAKGDTARAAKIEKGGKVYINAQDDGAGVKAALESRDVQIEGDVMIDGFKGGTFGAALTTKDSYIKGRIGRAIANGNTKLYLANGARWENISKGSTDSDFDGSYLTHLKANNGNIFQYDTKDLTIERLSGKLNVYYKHVNDGTETEDYGSDPSRTTENQFYGNTHIKNADPNSEINMVTDSSGIDMSNEDKVKKVLNALASKLYYDAAKSGEANLKGTASIAEGLTTSSNRLRFGELGYWSSNGRAYVKSTDTKPIGGEIHKQIAESEYDANQTKAFWKGKGIYDGNGNYTFKSDTKIVVKAADRPVISVKDNKFGAIYWNGDVNGTIDMTGHRLDIKAGPGGRGLLPGQGPNAGWERTSHGIIVYSGTLTIKNVKGMNIETDPKGALYGRGIYVSGYPGGGNHNSGSGKAKLVIENDDKWEHAVRIRVNHKNGEDFGAIEARVNRPGTSAEVDIKGLVDIDSKMWRAVESHGARVSIGGGIIKGTDVASIAAYDYGTVFVNSKLDNGKVVATSKTRPVQITGDISSESNGHVVLGLNNKNSFFKGLVSTDIWGVDKSNQKPYSYIPGKVSILLANGATWEHKQVGVGYVHKKETGANRKGSSPDSRVTRLQADKGILKQYDKHKLTIDNYSGNMQLVYQHDGDGTKAENYKAGDVHIKKAEQGSFVTMVTDRSGLKLDNAQQVYKVLSALAGKLYYDGYKNGEKNLNGAATISEGLTESSATLKTATMKWSEKTGQGSLKDPEPKPPTPNPNPNPPTPNPNPNPPTPNPNPNPPTPNPNPNPPTPNPNPKPKPKIEYGDYETKIMSGTKSAMISSIMVWRAEANDLMKRMGDLRLSPEDSGVWAHVYRGKASSEQNRAIFDLDYTTIQIGYDKSVSDDWRVGIAGSYMQGSATYEKGSGDNKETNFGIYGTWSATSGEYVDLIAKVGKLSSNYTVYNDFNHYVKGDYNTLATSLSAEYGKRINIKGSSFIEPQLELIYSHINGASYGGDTDYKEADGTYQKLYVDQGALNSFVGRLGIGFGQEMANSTWFLKASVYHEFGNGMSTDYSDGKNPKKTTKYGGQDTWVGLQLGATMKLSDNTSFYGTFEKTFGGDIKTDWRIDAGLRWSF